MIGELLLEMEDEVSSTPSIPCGLYRAKAIDVESLARQAKISPLTFYQKLKSDSHEWHEYKGDYGRAHLELEEDVCAGRLSLSSWPSR